MPTVGTRHKMVTKVNGNSTSYFEQTFWNTSNFESFLIKMETVADIAAFSLEPTDTQANPGRVGFVGLRTMLLLKKDKRIKAMLLHYAGEAVFELRDVVGVTENDNFAETKQKLTEYFRPQCNEEYEIFKFSQAEQMAAETLDQYNA